MKLKQMKPGGKADFRFIILFLILILLGIFVKSGYLLQSMIMILLYAYWSSSWNIIGGFAGQMSLGHATYIGIGAYVSTVLLIRFGLSPWIGMLIGGLVAGFFGVLMGIPTFRLKGVYYTLSTMALLNTVRLVMASEEYIFGFRTNAALGIKMPWYSGFSAMQFLEKSYYYYIILCMLGLVMFVSSRIKRSRDGYYLAAITTNENAALSLGVNVSYYKLKAQFFSCFFTALGGTFYAQLIMYLDPNRLFGYDLSLELTVLAMIGGRATVFGPVLGALLLVPVSEAARTYLGATNAGLALVVYGVVLMLTVYFMPNGLLHFFKKIAEKARFAGNRGRRGDSVG